MTKYEITITAVGCIIVNAPSPEDARRYINERLTMAGAIALASWADESPEVQEEMEAEADAVAVMTINHPDQPAEIHKVSPLFTRAHIEAIANAIANADRFDDNDLIGASVVDEIGKMLTRDNPAFDPRALEG